MTAWIYKNQTLTDDLIPEKSLGFLYKITHISTGKWYIGRKLLTKPKTTTVAGKKKKVRVESDWKDYWSSNTEIQEAAKIAPQDFSREILIFVTTKGAMAYAEEFLLYKSGALFDPLCYNGNIRAKIMRNWFTKTPNLHSELNDLIL